MRDCRRYIKLKDNQPSRMYTITAGDPGRGSISLESPTAPVAGTKVQVMLSLSFLISKMAFDRFL